MKSWRWLLLPAVAGLALLLAAGDYPPVPGSAAHGPSPGDFVPGELLVKVRRELARAGDVSAVPGARAVERIPDLDLIRVGLPGGIGVLEAADLYARLPWVEFAEPNYYVRADVVPNDPFYGSAQSWYYDLIQAPAAWDITTASPDIVVAVLDTGIDLDHPDLNANLWVNTADPTDGLDNDGNTIVDDTQGAAFVSYPTNSGDDPDFADCRDPQPQNDPQDDNGHGTMVAGIVGAETDNGVGVAGTAWRIRLMPVKVLDCNGLGLTSDIAQGIDYAAAQGAGIINLSLAQCVRNPCDTGSCQQPGVNQTLQTAIQQAHANGTILVGAAGNEVCPYVAYPAAFPEVIAVGATASPPKQYQRADFSNYGTELDLVAPGENICSTAWDPELGSAYDCRSGTSLSTPLVSGLAALLLSAHPSFTRVETRLFLECSAGDMGPAGVDPQYGHGMVQALDALRLGGACSGTLLTGSGPEVYVMQGGLRRHIPNRVTFEAKGFLWGNVKVITDSSLASIPQGQPLLDSLADGNLLRGSGDAVYVMAGGKKRHIVSRAVFNGCKYGWEAVQTIPNALLTKVPTGSNLTGPPCPWLSPPSGALLAGSGPEVYVMQGGLRRHIPNRASFEANGFLWGNLNVIRDSSLAGIPLGQPLLDSLADGNLLRGAGDAVYVTEGGKKRLIVSQGVFDGCNYGSDSVQAIPDALLDAVPTGPDLAGSLCPWLSPPSGVLLTGPGPEIYVMQGGLRRHIPNRATFEAKGFLWGNVNVIADSSLAGIPPGQPLLDSLADGNLLRGSGDAVYVMEDGKKRHVVSPAVFNGCKYGWDAVQAIPNALSGNIPTGSDVTGSPCPSLSPQDGTLLQGTSDPVYVMENNQKRHIASREAFEACGYRWGNINRIADSSLANIPPGPELANC